MQRYNVSQETYRQRFRSVRRKEEESYAELVVRLEDLLHKWMKGCADINDVLERVLVEQLLSTIPEALRVWVAERKPITGSNAGELADNYLQARQQATRMGGDGRRQDHASSATGVVVRRTSSPELSTEEHNKRC